MTAPVIRGWCPGTLRPMMSGDGLVLRLRAPLGRFSPHQAAGVAELSQRFGNGLLDLTARANLQIRGVAEADHGAIITALGALGLVDPDPDTEARRNIVVQPFWEAGDDTARIAEALDVALRAPDAPQTPGKFGYAVDCGPVAVLRNTSADIRIERAGAGLICRADGAETGAPVTKETAAETALELARWFLDTGGAPEGRGRMAAHVNRLGQPVRPASSRAAPASRRLQGNRLSAAHCTQCAGDRPPGRGLHPHPWPGATLTDYPPAPGPTPSGQLVALEFGQINAGTLARLASLGPLRLTPWRMLLLEGVTEAPDLPGLIHDASDPRLRIHVCTGAPGCPQALSETRPLARSLAPHLTENQSLHISGCVKGCAHPGPAPLTLTASAEGRFDLIHEGRASDTPSARALDLDVMKEALAHAP